MSRKISVDEVFSLLVNLMPGIDISQEKDKCYQWIKQSILRIGTRDVALPHKECTIDITNFRGDLPSDFYKIIAVKTDAYTYARYTGESFVYFDKSSPYLANGGFNGFSVPFNYGVSKYYISGRVINIAPSPPKVGLSYTAIPLDSKGLPLCDELHGQAIATYLRYQIIASRYFSEKIGRAIYLDAKQEWETERTRAQYIDDQISPDEAEYVGTIFSHHFGAPDINYGNTWGFPYFSSSLV